MISTPPPNPEAVEDATTTPPLTPDKGRFADPKNWVIFAPAPVDEDISDDTSPKPVPAQSSKRSENRDSVSNLYLLILPTARRSTEVKFESEVSLRLSKVSELGNRGENDKGSR